MIEGIHMTPQEHAYRRQYEAIVSAFNTAFPGVSVPAPSWITIWLTRYSYYALLEAIATLENHPPQVKARFTQESVGRAISALLRDAALRRAIPSDSGARS
jgi:hypothetical protein